MTTLPKILTALFLYMTEEQVKEQLSQHFIGAIASFKNVKIVKPYDDNGVDILLKKVKKIKFQSKIRYIDSGDILAIQLKATTHNSVEQTSNTIKFDLPIKNYNDLIFRREEWNQRKTGNVPLILIVVILPIDSTKWLEIDNQKEFIKLGGKAFWFYPDLTLDYSRNQYSKRIEIPIEQEINLDFFSDIFNLFKIY